MTSPLDNPYAPPGALRGEPPVLAQPVEESESVVRVDYQLTLEDLVEYNFFFQSHISSMRRQWLLFRMFGLTALGVAALSLVAGVTQPGSGLAIVAPATGVLGLLLFYVTSPSRRKAGLRRLLTGMLREGKNENLFSLHRVWVSPRGIRRISRYADTTYQWPVVEKIAVGPHAAYIYDSAASAIVVPRSAFGSEAEFRHFVETAEQFWKEAAK